MTYRKVLSGVIVITMVVLFTSLVGAKEPKRALKDNMVEIYNVLPGNAENFREVFTKGVVYGRLRTNYFKYIWDDNSKYDPKASALGGSLIYKLARLQGISGTVGFYTSQNLGLLDNEDARYGKSGKDCFSRYDVLKDGRWNMTVLAQAYLQYNFMESDLKLGRQIFESFLTSSNDTKMIPNTFYGTSLVSEYLPQNTISLAYFDKQKLRDHTTFHDVITYGDGGSETYSNWANNDDSAVHQGLSYNNLLNGGKDTDNELLIAGINNKAVKNLELDFWYNGVPDLFYSLMGEVNYEILLGDGWSLTPGFRYMEQFDEGAGQIGGAALTGVLAGVTGPAKGYDEANNVDGKLYGGRLVLKKGPGKLHFGYTYITDDADLIAPWRGFPTGGYSRSMAQSNWEADTRSWMVLVGYDFDRAGIIQGCRTALDFTRMDYDDKKERLGGTSTTDRHIIHADLWYKLPFFPELEAKGRIGLVNADTTTAGKDPSYDEFRFELNYLF